MEEEQDTRSYSRTRIKKDKYHLLKSDSDPQWDSGGNAATTGHTHTTSRNQVGNKYVTAVGRRGSEENVRETADSSVYSDAGVKRSPSDPLRPIKLKMIPRGIQVSHSASASGSNGGGVQCLPFCSPSVPCNTFSGVSPHTPRGTHTAILHSTGVHSLLRNPPGFLPPQQGLQTPTSFLSMGMRCGRRCSSPQTPMSTGCQPYSTRIPPRSAQTSPSAPKSPKLTSSNSDPWSATLAKNYRTQSIGGAVPPGEMDWLPAPSPCSRKSSWSSVSTDNDSSSPCW
ncbi:uncharacterized protein [Cherax quadricarinatus]|uniref:uncharacterized protein n=1 Tax=Cherax quadricarinatus TaxID=27406 RepID=UPI00387E6566